MTCLGEVLLLTYMMPVSGKPPLSSSVTVQSNSDGLNGELGEVPDLHERSQV